MHHCGITEVIWDSSAIPFMHKCYTGLANLTCNKLKHIVEFFHVDVDVLGLNEGLSLVPSLLLLQGLHNVPPCQLPFTLKRSQLLLA